MGVRVREQRKVKRRSKALTTKPLMAILGITPQVGKNVQDLGGGMKVLWCHSHLVLLVFEGSIPKCTFLSRKLFVTFL